ncbi:hypothetical protein GQX74_012793 [Glossina fuscipes]|nr:hypothetical protein GQX74_012793 [Glossina fuscipes]
MFSLLSIILGLLCLKEIVAYFTVLNNVKANVVRKRLYKLQDVFWIFCLKGRENLHPNDMFRFYMGSMVCKNTTDAKLPDFKTINKKNAYHNLNCQPHDYNCVYYFGAELLSLGAIISGAPQEPVIGPINI